MIKKHLFVFVASLLMAFTLSAQRFVIVDINAVLEKLPEYKKAQTELDNISATWRQQIAEEYDKIKSMYNKYQAEQVLLSNEARKAREEEIIAKEDMVRELQKEKFGPEGQLFRKRLELVQPIQERVYKEIESFASDRGYDFIFDKSGNAGLIFYNPDYDKTQDVMRIMGIR
jgi:outer membrane protein